MLLRRLPMILSWARPLAYASEVGESFRPVISRSLVRFLYAISWAYVITDTIANIYFVQHLGSDAMLYTGIDKAIFHTFASMAIPAYTIHSIVKYSRKVFRYAFGLESKIGRWGPVLIGLGAIPHIIHPIDHATEWVMDKTLREYVYKGKLDYGNLNTSEIDVQKETKKHH